MDNLKIKKMLSIDNLHVGVDGKPILNGINLDVRAGEVHAIMGPNGSGKSTLSSAIAGNETYEVENPNDIPTDELKEHAYKYIRVLVDNLGG